MQFLTALFGGAENTILTAAFALGIVLVMILLGLWVLKFFFNASANMSRGRTKRLTVVDSVQIDPRRKVVILRRDNVEHVIMTGGPQDVLVESGIAVERPGARRPAQAQPKAQSQPAAEAEMPVAHTKSLPQPMPRGPMERLREARSTMQRKAPPLRNTGLLRPVGRGDPAVIPMNGYNSEASPSDSATTSPNETNGQAKLGAASTSRYLTDGFKAEGNK
jgi:flagellar protein FliO/FliZ